MEHIVIAGTGAAGLSTLQGLRREGFTGRVTMIGEEDREPYDRPPLSKQFLAGKWDVERLRLCSPSALSELDAEWLRGTRAASLDLTARRIRLSTGDSLGYDRLVIATGVRPRTFPGAEPVAGVHTLRTLDDAMALRTALARGPAVAVIGAGPLGSEIAATVRTGVTLIDVAPTPLHRQLGPVVGRHLADLHRQHGRRLRMGVGVTGLRTDQGRVTGVRLDDGTTVDADLVLVAIGSIPNTEWLTDSGLTVTDGVDCDATCAAAPGVYAAGDVARWYHAGGRRSIRIEHRMNATEQGLAVARALLSATDPFTPVPFFWTDHYDTTIQVRGFPEQTASFEVVDGAVADGRFVGLYRTDDRVTAVLSCNNPKTAREYHGLLNTAG